MSASGAVLANGLNVRRARGFAGRLRGWLGRSRIEPDEGLWIEPCGAVHAFGMCVSVDVVFLDAGGRILRIAGLAPWRIRGCRGARIAVELAEGAAARHGLRVGEVWAWPPTSELNPKQEQQT